MDLIRSCAVSQRITQALLQRSARLQSEFLEKHAQPIKTITIYRNTSFIGCTSVSVCACACVFVYPVSPLTSLTSVDPLEFHEFELSLQN